MVALYNLEGGVTKSYLGLAGTSRQYDIIDHLRGVREETLYTFSTTLL